MNMQFTFMPEKAFAVLEKIVQNENHIEIKKAMKLMYLMEKAHLQRYGRQIADDRLCAITHGPVPSNTLALIENNKKCARMIDFKSSRDTLLHFFKIENNQLIKNISPDMDVLSTSDVQVIDEILNHFKTYNTDELIEYTHNLPEYKIFAGRKNKEITIEYITEECTRGVKEKAIVHAECA